MAQVQTWPRKPSASGPCQRNSGISHCCWIVSRQSRPGVGWNAGHFDPVLQPEPLADGWLRDAKRIGDGPLKPATVLQADSPPHPSPLFPILICRECSVHTTFDGPKNSAAPLSYLVGVRVAAEQKRQFGASLRFVHPNKERLNRPRTILYYSRLNETAIPARYGVAGGGLRPETEV